MRKIRAFITGWNDRSHPFAWTKSPEEILAEAKPKQLQTRATRSQLLHVFADFPLRQAGCEPSGSFLLIEGDSHERCYAGVYP